MLDVACRRLSRSVRAFPALVVLVAVAGFGGLGYMVAPGAPAPGDRAITIRMRQYGYDPGVIRVNRGDTVHLHFVSDDVVHGFYLEGHDLNVTIVPLRETVEVRRPSRPGERRIAEEVVFKAEREGKFRYRCSQTCGFLHPFMLGEFIVRPNRLLAVSLGMTAGVLLGGLAAALLLGEMKP